MKATFNSALALSTLSAFCLILTACQHGPAIVLPPVELTECGEEPQTPDLPAKDGSDATQMIRDTATMAYIFALHEAYSSCKARVMGLKAWLEKVG